MDFSIFAYVAILLLVALLSTRLMRVIKLPNVTGYIITGIIMGPFIFGLLFNNFSFDGIKENGIIYGFVDKISWVSTVALGFIAFSIGTSFKRQTIKALGKRVIVITVLEALGASVLVILALLVAHFIFPQYVSWQIVLTLSAIASATAPAATLMVIKQYNARGPLVNTLLPVVALDDAAALILFAILFQLASALSGGTITVYTILVKPLLEIIISLAVGTVLGLIISLMNGWFKSRNNRLIWCIFSVFAALGIYYLFKSEMMGKFELSSLLICMMAGAIYTNMVKESNRTLDVMDRFTSPIYMMFFVISGASLDLTVFFNGDGLIVVAIAAIYIVFRVLGKWTGAFAGASITRCEPQVRKYIGFALVPQAGVAIGLATTAYRLFNSPTASEELQRAGALILAIILTSTLVYELIGPMVAKFALTKAHEIPEENL